MTRSKRFVRSASRCALLALVFVGAGPFTLEKKGDPAPALDALFPSGRLTTPLDQVAARIELAPGEGFKVVEVARDPGTSHHVVAIRDREQPHRHDTHDLIVVVLRGQGFMRLGAEERAVGEGSILYVPRATVHAFRNVSDSPAVAYAIYTPPFDGKDRVVVP